MPLPVGHAVHSFMELMGQTIKDKPQLPDDAMWAMRKRLLEEELAEILLAIEQRDLPGYLDGLVDLTYIAAGGAVECGLPFDPAFDMVHRANMAKSTKCGPCDGLGRRGVHQCSNCEGRGIVVIFREDGKVLKPDDWVAPDIASLLDAYS